MAVIFFLLVVLSSAAELSAGSSSEPSEFIRSSCRATRYPDLCVQCLAAYGPTVRRSPRQLAHVALTVSADRARAAAGFVAKLSANPPLPARAAGAVRDCIETMADSVDRLVRSVDEMGRLGRAGSEQFTWHMSNVQTWVSAALTDENTCLDGLAESGAAGTVKAAIRSKVVEVAQVTSNGLALVNRIGSRK